MSRLFDEGCAKTRLKELTEGFMSQLALKEMEKRADEEKRAFKPVSEYQGHKEQFREQATIEAQKVFEQERQNYVTEISNYIRNSLLIIQRRLTNMVYAVDLQGKPFRIQILNERIVAPNHRGEMEERDDAYVLDHDYERLKQINVWKSHLTEFEQYAPYMSETLKELWNKVLELANLETVRVEKNAKEENVSK